MNSMSELAFPVKSIQWSAYEQKSPILLQEENGPCPLIALVNTLIVQSDIASRTVDLETPVTETNGSSAQNRPGNGVKILRNLLNRHVGETVQISEILCVLGDMLMEKTTLAPDVVENLLESLPLLHTGLDVNPNMATGAFPPEEVASQMFAAFGLEFVHGWRWEPNESAANAIFERLQTFAAVQDYTLAQPRDGVERAEVEDWLAVNGTQLTNYGLRELDRQLAEDSVAIFFRNNHFSTLYKAQNHDFYLLLTDHVFARKPTYVWQSLSSVSGAEDLFFAGDFSPIAEELESGETCDENYMLAQQLQEEEDSAYAQKLQDSYRKRNSKTERKEREDMREKKERNEEKKEKKEKKQKKEEKKGKKDKVGDKKTDKKGVCSLQ